MNYAKNDMEAARAAREAMDRVGIRWWKAGVGTNYVRVAPPHVSMVDPDSGTHRFYHPVCLHFSVGPNKKVIPCPRRMLGKFCPICDAGFALKNAGQEEAGNELLPSWQAYMSIIVYAEVRSEPTPEFPKGKVIGLEPVRNKDGKIEVQTWSAPRGVLDQIFDAIDDRQTEIGGFIDIADPEQGYVLKIVRKGTEKNNTKYRVTLDREPTSIMEFVDEWDEQLSDLTGISPVVDTEGVRALLEGSDSDPFEKKAIAAPKAVRVEAKPRFDDDDVVEGEFKDISDDEEEAAPTPASASAARRLKDLIDGKKERGGD